MKSERLFYTSDEAASEAVIPTCFLKGYQDEPRCFDMNRATSVLSQINNMKLLSQVENWPAFEKIEQIGSAVAEKLCSIFILDPIPNHMRAVSPLSTSLAQDASNIAGVLAAMDPERKKQVEDELTRYLKPLPEKDINKVWAETVDRFKSMAMLYCEEAWTEHEPIEMDAQVMSDGTLRFLGIIIALLTIKEHSLIVIEEVDNALHPSRSEDLVMVLKTLGAKRNIDILCTTHNPVLIDALGDEIIPFISIVKRDEKGNSNILLLEDVKNLPKMMATYSVGGLMVKDKLK